MSRFEAVQTAVAAWLEQVDPEGALVVVLTARDLGTLHALLAQWQELLTSVGLEEETARQLGVIRKRVEEALVQAGYGGDPRP